MYINHGYMAYEVKYFTGPEILSQWTRKASIAMMHNDTERFHECMALVHLWNVKYYSTKKHGRIRMIESWKNYVFHFRNFNREYRA